MRIDTTRGVSLYLSDTGPLGCPLVLEPRVAGPTIPGSVYVHSISNEFRHLDSGGVERLNWNSLNGLSTASQASVSTAATTANVAGTVVVQSTTYTFVSGARYWIEMGVELGRFTGSTRNVQISATVGGVALAFSGFIVELFETGGATQLERSFRRRIMFTAGASGVLAVVLQTSVSGGAGNYNWGASGINIEGHYD